MVTGLQAHEERMVREGGDGGESLYRFREVTQISSDPFESLFSRKKKSTEAK